MAKKTNTGEQTKLFHKWLKETFNWVDNDVKKYMLRAWFASVKANKELKDKEENNHGTK
jgi:hypothetical protein